MVPICSYAINQQKCNPNLFPNTHRERERERERESQMKKTKTKVEETKTRTQFHTHRVNPIAPFNRLHALLYSGAVIALVYHRLTSPFSLSTISLLVAELVLALMWGTSQAFRWRPVRRREFPERLMASIGKEGLPALDVFVCTADPYKELPSDVASTVLSVMGFDYPTDRLSVYVSDDGGSDMTLFALMEAARFARHWLPFCRENGIEQRSPEAYFRDGEVRSGHSDEIKMMYQTMKGKLEAVMEKGFVGDELANSEEDHTLFHMWKGYTRRDHPSIIQVLLQSRTDTDMAGNPMPNLVYVSREKCGSIPHHFKAGALNTLVRVSNVMTDAPVILTLDCDMYSNDPRSPHRALCYLLDPAIALNLAFVQFPQSFRGMNKNDIYACELKRTFHINAWGMDGIRGPEYLGSCCFHARNSFLGPPATTSPLTFRPCDSMCSETVLKRAGEMASCRYERGTKWGSVIGFRYGSLVEDYYTSYRLHCEGWKSVLCDPERPAFLGEAIKSLNDTLGQCTRWSVGLHEVTFSRYSPLAFGIMRASLLTGLSYAHYAFWPTWFIPATIYALIPQLALANEIPLFPKLSDPWFYLYAYLFLAAYGQDLMEFVAANGTVGKWWNDQRMWMIRGVTAFSFGTAQFVLNRLRISTLGFNVTSKVTEDELKNRYDKGVFEFGVVSPFFFPLGIVAIVNLTSFVAGAISVVRKEGVFDRMFVQLFLSGFVMANCWPIYEAMIIRRDEGRMRAVVTSLSILNAVFLQLLAYFMFNV